MKYFPLRLLCLLFVLFGCESELTGPELIKKSIQYHDPKNEWNTLRKSMYFSDSRPEKDNRHYEVQLDIPNSYFKYINRGEELIYEVEGQNCLSAESGTQACDRALMLRNYYTFLWGLPMKLMDEGAEIEKEVNRETLQGVEAYVVKVPYEQDVWYFYLNPDTFQLIAYKFYKEEEKGIGEIIFLKDEIIVDNMKIPSTRSWYRTENDEFLGTDYLLKTSDF